MDSKMTKIPHLRICVTEKCDHKCIYCRPGGEACELAEKKEMSLRQIYQLVSLLCAHGIEHLKITGGEPMMRDDLPKLVKLLKTIPNTKSVEMVTRSPQVGKIADQLNDAGLSCLNFSLDSINPHTSLIVTKSSNLEFLLQAIQICHQEGLKLKFNMVVMKGINDQDIPAMIDLAGRYGAVLKLLDLMNITNEPHFMRNYYQPLDSVADELAKQAKSHEVVTPPGGCGTPMSRFEMPNGAVVIIKDARIGTWYSDICIGCRNYPCQDAIMALRLNSGGQLQRCLLRNDNLIDLLNLVDGMHSQENIDEAIDTALRTYHHATYREGAWKP